MNSTVLTISPQQNESVNAGVCGATVRMDVNDCSSRSRRSAIIARHCHSAGLADTLRYRVLLELDLTPLQTDIDSTVSPIPWHSPCDERNERVFYASPLFQLRRLAGHNTMSPG